MALAVTETVGSLGPADAGDDQGTTDNRDPTVTRNTPATDATDTFVRVPHHRATPTTARGTPWPGLVLPFPSEGARVIIDLVYARNRRHVHLPNERDDAMPTFLRNNPCPPPSRTGFAQRTRVRTHPLGVRPRWCVFEQIESLVRMSPRALRPSKGCMLSWPSDSEVPQRVIV